MAGTIGGGCVEAEVWNAAREVLETEKPKRLTFNLGQDAAYDNGLIFLDENYDMRINPAKMAHLAALQQDGGIDDFRCPLGRILLPQDNAQWPHPQIIRRANVLRLIGS